jgi:signal transduction histidine kinase
LNAISLSVQGLERYLTEVPEEFRSLLRTVQSEIKRLEESIRRFLTLTSPLALIFKSGDFNDLVTEVLNLVEEEARGGGVRLETDLWELKPVRFDREKMREVLLNLVRNGLQAMPEGGKLEVQTRQERDRIVVLVRDSGQGISPEDLEKIFTPYFTTRSNGSGIGLSYVHRVVSAHRGTVSADSEPGNGATFKLEIPNG